MRGKKVWIHSKNDDQPREVDFVSRWTPVVSAIGAEVILDTAVPHQDEASVAQWMNAGKRAPITDLSLPIPQAASASFSRTPRASRTSSLRRKPATSAQLSDARGSSM